MFSDSCHKYRIFEYLTQKNHLLNLVMFTHNLKKNVQSHKNGFTFYCFKKIFYQFRVIFIFLKYVIIK